MAQELVQRTFLGAFEHPGAYDPSRGDPWAWLLGLALNHLKALRRERARSGRMGTEPASVTEAHPMEAMEAEEGRRKVREALTSLPVEMQRLLEECDMRARPVSAVARELGMPASTAFDRLAEARRAFRNALGGADA